jgi:hypothetical protein
MAVMLWGRVDLQHLNEDYSMPTEAELAAGIALAGGAIAYCFLSSNGC